MIEFMSNLTLLEMCRVLILMSAGIIICYAIIVFYFIGKGK